MAKTPDESVQRSLRQGSDVLEERVATDLGAKIRHVRRYQDLNPLIFPVYELPQIKPEQMLDFSGYHHIHDIARETNVKVEAVSADGRINIIFDVTKPYVESADAAEVAKRTALSLEKLSGALAGDLARLAELPGMNPLVYPINEQERASVEEVTQGKAYQRLDAIARENNVKIEVKKQRGRAAAIIVDAARTYDDRMDKQLAAPAPAKSLSIDEQAGNLKDDIARARRHPQLNPFTFSVNADGKISPEQMVQNAAYRRMHETARELNVKIKANKKFRQGITSITVDISRPYLESPDAEAVQKIRDAEKAAARAKRRAENAHDYEEAVEAVAVEAAASLQRQFARNAESQRRETLAAEKDINLQQFAKQNLPDIINRAVAEGLNGSFTIAVPEMTAAELRKSEAYKALHHAGSRLDKRIEMGTRKGITTIFVSTNESYAASTHAKKFGFLQTGEAKHAAAAAPLPRMRP